MVTDVMHTKEVKVHVKTRRATPIYLLVLPAQEVGNEPFWNKKKVEKCDFFNFF